MTVSPFELVVEPAGEAPRTLSFASASIVIGRPRAGHEPDLDLSPDSTVSRPHARIATDGAGVWIEDLDSKSGTLVNHRDIRGLGRWSLSREDVIVIGTTRLRVLSAPLRTAPAATSHTAAGPTAGPTAASVSSGDATKFAPGTVIGNYEVFEMIGEGGMGAVYRAQQVHLERQVALKTIKVRVDGNDLLRRFELERVALAAMDHENIAKIFEAGVLADGTPWFAMELVPGLPLDAHCDSARLPVSSRVALLRRVCLATQHAHERGVVHRDLKPGNVLVVNQAGGALPKVIDFGLARSLAPVFGPRINTEPGRVLGTMQYMAPEQATGGARAVDARADIYALGVILHELLVGTVPFPPEKLVRDGVFEAHRVLSEEMPPLPSECLCQPSAASDVAAKRRTSISALRRELERELDWVVAKAMRKNPVERYETAAAMADDLARYLAFRPVAARPTSAKYAVSRLLSRMLRARRASE